MDYYQTIEKSAEAEFKDRGSRFIAYAFPVLQPEDFKKKLQELKKEHPKAVHHCFGYRIGFQGDQFRANDDGEPSGSAGKPILGQIDSKELTNVAVVVVRYFGGSLLGVPGLINAYKTATALSLQMIPIVRKPVTQEYKIEFDYHSLNEVMRVIKSCESTVVTQETGLFCTMKVAVPKNREMEVIYRMKELRNVEFSKIL